MAGKAHPVIAAICSGCYTVPAEARYARCVTPRLKIIKRRDGVDKTGVAKRCEATPAPMPA